MASQPRFHRQLGVNVLLSPAIRPHVATARNDSLVYFGVYIVLHVQRHYQVHDTPSSLSSGGSRDQGQVRIRVYGQSRTLPTTKLP